MQGNESYLGF